MKRPRFHRKPSMNFVTNPTIAIISVIAVVFLLSLQGLAQSQFDTIRSIMGTQGEVMPGDVLRFDLTREDINASIAGHPAKPDLLTEGFAAFRPAGTGKAFMIVELGLKQSEVNPAMTVVIRNSLTKDTALHNHWLFENPRLMFLHFTGYGDAAELAHVVRQVLAKTSAPPPATPPQSHADVPGLNDSQIKSIIQPDDAVNAHGVLSLTVDRNGVKYNGMSLPPAMGAESDFNFQPLGGGQAELAAEFSLTANEVEPVLNVLRSYNINVTAEHNHFLLESPRLFYIHAWGVGNDITLAKAVRAALNRTAMK
jgi:Domain of Unknown Function (DUF1259)